MENKEKLAKQTTDSAEKEEIKNLNKKELDSTSGGVITAAVGLGALAGLGAVTAYSAYKSSKHGKKEEAVHIRPHTKPYQNVTAKKITNTGSLKSNSPTAEEIIEKIYKSNSELPQNKKITDINDLSKLLEI